MGTVWTFAETEAYRRRAEVTARLLDLENACIADDAKAAAAKARDERAAAEFAELVARARRSTPRATATRKAELPVVRVAIGGGRVERRMAAWYLPGGGQG